MIRALAVATIALAATPAAAQSRPAAPYWHPNPQPPPLPAIATDATDAAAIDALVARVYAAISGPAGPRDWAAFRALFVPEARLVPIGAKGPVILDIDGYIARAGAAMATEGFHEREVARRVERYGNLAHVFSTYDSRHAPGDARPFARGINSFQLVRTSAGWRVLHIVWQGETPALPIPPAYAGR